MEIEIKKYNYNNSCELAGCRNMAKLSISKPNQPTSRRLLVCSKCLENIIEAAPLEILTKAIASNKDLQKSIASLMDEEVIINEAMERTKEYAEKEGVIDTIKGENGENNGENAAENGKSEEKKNKADKKKADE